MKKNSLWNYAANVAVNVGLQMKADGMLKDNEGAVYAEECGQEIIYNACRHIVISMLRNYVASRIEDFQDVADDAMFVMDRERRSLQSADYILYQRMVELTNEFFENNYDFFIEVDIEELL